MDLVFEGHKVNLHPMFPHTRVFLTPANAFSTLECSNGDMKILFVASEGLPFSKTGGLADVIEALPKSLAALGHEVAVLLPRYRNTRAVAVAVPSLTVPMGDGLRFPAIADGGTLHGVHYYFVDDPEYFDREQLYGIAGKDYPDNAERFGGILPRRHRILQARLDARCDSLP